MSLYVISLDDNSIHILGWVERSEAEYSGSGLQRYAHIQGRMKRVKQNIHNKQHSTESQNIYDIPTVLVPKQKYTDHLRWTVWL